MTRAELLALPAGEALDALVAERVMHLPPEQWRSRCYVERHSFDNYEFDGTDEHGWCYTCRECVGAVGGKVPPRFSTDIAAAWTVVEHLTASTGGLIGYGFQLTDCRPGLGWLADFQAPTRGNRGPGETAPLAICRAALLTTLEPA